MKWIDRIYIWACRRLYNEFAGRYDLVSWVVSFGRWPAWRRAALDHVCGSAVLEIGFGTGRLLQEMAQQGFSPTGLELSRAMHVVAARNLRMTSAQVALVCGRAQTLPFADDSFSDIVSTFPAPYILEEATLQECVRVLRVPGADDGRSGGRLVIVGLWVSLEHSILRFLLPVFYGRPSEEMLRLLTERLQALGTDVTLHEHSDGFARVGSVVAQRQSENIDA